MVSRRKNTPEQQLNGKIYPEHCLSSSSDIFDGDQWVRAEIVALSAVAFIHYVCKNVLEYLRPQYRSGSEAEFRSARRARRGSL
jgi:hypothetical protein